MFDKFLIHGIQTTHGDVHGVTKSGTEKRGKGEIYLSYLYQINKM